MKTDFDYRDPLCLAIAVRAGVLRERPDVQFYVTCNPGDTKPGGADEHYIALCERVYEYKDPVSTPAPGRFVGYVTYRMKEVRFHSKLSYLLEVSSIEVRKADFSKFLNGKVHFAPSKFLGDDSQAYATCMANATANPSGNGIDFDMATQIGKVGIKLVVEKVLGMLDGTLV